MSYALALIGFLGFFITNIYMIIQAVKKKFRKNYCFHHLYVSSCLLSAQA